MSKNLEITAISLNCWGLPFVTQDKEARVREIGHEINKIKPSIVGFQELYLEEDQNTISEIVKDSGLIHSKYFESGLFGSGLFMLSSFPIIEAEYFPFSLNGDPQDLIRPDYYAGKGLARIQVETPIGLLDFYNTHLIAQYLEIGDDLYYHHRLFQCFEMANIINQSSPNVPVILTGDMNSMPDSLEHQILIDIANLSDSFQKINPDDPGYTVSEEIPYILKHEPVRIDYVYYRGTDTINIMPNQSKVSFNTLPATNIDEIEAFSDHYGVETIFEFSNESQGVPAVSSETQTQTISAVITELEKSQQELTNTKPKKFIWLGMTNLLLIISIILLRAPNMSRRRFLRFMLWVTLSLMLILSGTQISGLNNLNEEDQKISAALAQLEDYLRTH